MLDRIEDALVDISEAYDLHATRKQYDRALSFYKQMVALEPDNAVTAYNIACMNARLNKAEESLKWLRKAVSSGYNNWDLIRTDKDLENIRGFQYYKNLISGH